MLSNLRFPRLRVLETTDFHGAILGGQRERRTNRPIGGSPAVAAAIEHYRSREPAGTVLIDGGDLFRGTMISNLQFGRPVVEQMNFLGYAAAAIGNHEFDWTADTLKNRVLNMQFAALGANMLERKTNKRPWWVRSDTTVTRAGVKVGIFGLPTGHAARHRCRRTSRTCASPTTRSSAPLPANPQGRRRSSSRSTHSRGDRFDAARRTATSRGLRRIKAWTAGSAATATTSWTTSSRTRR